MPRGNIKMTYYLCYGAPLLDRSLDRRVDTLRLEGQGRLDGWKMTFSREDHQPNVVESPGAKVWGALYLIEEHKLAELDKEEAGGKRVSGTVYFEGRQEPAVWYTYPASAKGFPSKETVDAYVSLYVQAGLPKAQIDGALPVAK
jgi:gamma-glutamylcyclotransferase (GGCT)/AIG2-like uncharacterized protein YtfP